jgi:septation ring formation regulator EzrA
MDENGDTIQPKLVTQIAVLSEKVASMSDAIKDLKVSIERQAAVYISKEKHDSDYKELRVEIQNNKDILGKRLGTLEKLGYGMIGMVLTGFFGYIINLVFNR